MAAKNVYSIKLSDIGSDWPNYCIWKNDEFVDQDDLTVEEMKIFQKELLEFSEMFKEQIKYLEKL